MQYSVEKARAYAKAFRRPIFASLAKGEDPRNILNFFEGSDFFDEQMSLRELFTLAFDSVRKSYRNEYIYKSAITNRIVMGRHSPLTSSLAVELPVGNSIVDIAVFNGTSTAYEIKTEFDSPRRLYSQTPDYVKAFERVYIVTHPNLAERYCELNIPNVGIMTLSKRDSLHILKEASSNLESIDLDIIFNMLRRPEYVEIVENYTSEKLDMPNGLIGSYCKEIFCQIPINVAHKLFLNAMRARTTTKDVADFIYSLPACLRALGYATPLSKKQKEYLIKIMDLKMVS
ncbi:sce7726 family protein [Yersinia enterocolitica]|uniref:sce7726 family protein n=1 Tax=Yersinia enterocolitica TaxID=630 RepID=UPI0028665D7B|nr:sce7726 family protein [Yersinia enterocolitica]HDV5950485.1 sce7726 family protein [Yersinia enterocolitica]HDV7150285.1 sce7726 family protein [Yersinia enterocolitica]HED5572883.1 sce7726 family protein [Yersinia enterocolitica]